jgi:transposase
MRQAHPASGRIFVDYAGQTVDLIDGRSGEVRPAQIFVAATGASNYTLASAGAGSTTTSMSTGITIRCRID